ncbi:MAG: BamA/TamA family outer membrane protein [Hydrogenophaga sp.]|nr:BamA/TamA family outer membrane protein [Hydrogenophaga sp.]
MNLPLLRRVASTRLFCLLLLLPLGAAAQTPAASGPDAAGTAAAPQLELDGAATGPERFDIQLEAPATIQPFLLRHLDLQRYRNLQDLDGSELDRLLIAAPDNLRDLLGTQGHFSPQISVGREPATPGGAAAPALGTVRIRIEPGPITSVASSNVYFRGDIANAEAAAAQRETIQRSGQQAVGQDFTQAGWGRVKSDTLRLLTNERYPRGRIVNSLSDIDTTANAAHWHIELDSGAPVRIGTVRVEGAERYGTATVERLVGLAGLRPGADYSLTRLQDAQQKIADSGYYTSVFAYVDLEPGDDPASAAPVVVQVKEAQLQSVVLGVGGSTNNGPRLSAEHKHLRLPVIGWQALSKLQLERNDQQLSSDWSAPIEDDGWHWLAGGRLARQIDDETTISSLRLSAGKAQASALLDRRYFLQFDRARTVNTVSKLASSDGNDAAISANYGWTWRRFDTLPYPNRGYGLGLTLGVGMTLGGVRQPFVSTQARWLGYWPLDPVTEMLDDLLTLGQAPDKPASSSRNGRLALRLQGGAVLADADAPIPDTLLFLTGGDTTVRGYGLRDIGVVQPDGSVTAGRYLGVASFEWQRPIWRNSVRTPWESVLFVDAGVVTNQTSQVDAQLGVGAGLRYNSPVGPLQLDLAYGVDAKRFRVHLNVGFSF